MNILYWIFVIIINVFSGFALFEGFKNYDKAVLSIFFGGLVVLIPFMGQLVWTALLGWEKLGIVGLILPVVLIIVALAKIF